MVISSGWVFLLFLLPFVVSGQQKEYELTGTVYIKDGPTCGYIVSLKIDGDGVNGRSVTIQPDGRELYALIHGRINRKMHMMSFTESELPLSMEPDNCMFDVRLHYAVTNGNYVFSGSFIGNSDTKDSCDAGIVNLTIKKEHGNAFEPPRPKQKIVDEKKIVPEIKIEKPVEYGEITAAVKKELEWQTDSCVFEIWDGEVVDGDIVTIKLNGREMLASYSLVAEKKRIVLPVRGKINTITIYAENEGKAPPNTSMIRLTDGNVQYGVQAIIRQGETADIILKKKK